MLYAIGDLETDCRDEMPLCPKWAQQGECEGNPVFMKTNCQLSCAVCALATSPWEIQYKRSFDYARIVMREHVGVWYERWLWY